MTGNLAATQKKELHKKMVERSMIGREETQQSHILDKYTR